MISIQIQKKNNHKDDICIPNANLKELCTSLCIDKKEYRILEFLTLVQVTSFFNVFILWLQKYSRTDVETNLKYSKQGKYYLTFLTIGMFEKINMQTEDYI